MGTQKPLRFLQKGEPGDSPPLTLCLSHVRPGGEGDPRQGDPAAAGPLASGREGVKPAGPTTPPYQARPSTVAMATSRPARPPPTLQSPSRACAGRAAPLPFPTAEGGVRRRLRCAPRHGAAPEGRVSARHRQPPPGRRAEREENGRSRGSEKELY